MLCYLKKIICMHCVHVLICMDLTVPMFLCLCVWLHEHVLHDINVLVDILPPSGRSPFLSRPFTCVSLTTWYVNFVSRWSILASLLHCQHSCTYCKQSNDNGYIFMYKEVNGSWLFSPPQNHSPVTEIHGSYIHSSSKLVSVGILPGIYCQYWGHKWDRQRIR